DETAIQQLRWHFRDHENVIDYAGIDSAPRHTVVSGCFGTLGDRKPAALLDRAQSFRAVAAGAREDDSDGACTPILSKGAKESVDGVMASRGGQHEHAACNLELLPRRHDLPLI